MGWERWLKNTRFTLFRSAIIQEQFIQCILDHVPEHSSILESGFGAATTLELLRDMEYVVEGFDLESSAISLAIERFPLLKNKIHVGDILKKSSYKKKYTVIIHQGVLEHFSDKEILQILSIQSEFCDKIIFDVPNSLRKNTEDEGDMTRFETPQFWENIISAAGLQFERFGRTYDYGDELLPKVMKRYDSDFMKRAGRSSIFVVEKCK